MEIGVEDVVPGEEVIQLFKDQPFQNLAERRQDGDRPVVLSLQGALLLMQGYYLTKFPAKRKLLL